MGRVHYNEMASAAEGRKAFQVSEDQPRREQAIGLSNSLDTVSK